MLKRFAPVLLLLALVPRSYAQAPAESAPLASRAVMTGDQVIRILDETVDWYRTLGVQQQSATQPSDLLILYANRQTADRVVALAFEIARANAELLSSQAELKQDDAPDPSRSPQALQKSQKDLDARRASIQAEIAATQKQLADAQPAARGALQAKLMELQGELDLVNARRNLLSTMVELALQTDANGSGVTTLKDQINAIAASIPAANMDALAEGQDSMAAMGAAAPAQSTADQGGGGRPGIWDLASNVLRLQSKLATISEIERRTAELQRTFEQTRELPDQQLKLLSDRGDAMGARAASSDAAAAKAARDEYDTLAWLFKQTSSILVPLTKAGVLLGQYRSNLDKWHAAAQSQYREALEALAVRVAMLLVVLAVLLAAGELWRRAVLKYVHEARRRHQLLLVRRIVVWAVGLLIAGIAFATEVSSLATFAGLLTAGLAVAMQSVLVSIVGYFFLVGRYGLRVGDRVQIGGVTGDVIDLGLVRLHLMELDPRNGPTGRVVAFANSVVFQAAGGIFKQIPGVNLVWRELTLALPGGGDHAAIKQQLLATAEGVLQSYHDEFARQTRELRKTSSSTEAEEVRAYVNLRFAADSVEAIVRYPVPQQRAAEVEERMSRELVGVLRASGAEPARLTARPA